MMPVLIRSMEIADPAIRDLVREVASAVLGAGEPL